MGERRHEARSCGYGASRSPWTGSFLGCENCIWCWTTTARTSRRRCQRGCPGMCGLCPTSCEPSPSDRESGSQPRRLVGCGHSSERAFLVSFRQGIHAFHCRHSSSLGARHAGRVRLSHRPKGFPETGENELQLPPLASGRVHKNVGFLAVGELHLADVPFQLGAGQLDGDHA